uniref:O-antigen polymerase n=1 Tax=Bifidobacterium adolescentis TaxID=1680 RepID=UPI00359CB2C4
MGKERISGIPGIYAVIVPLLFFVLNYGVFKIKFNIIEFLMVVIITINTLFFYGNDHDYLDPIIYFPVLYFLLYWIGDFDFGFYPEVPHNMWILYLIGLIGFYFGTYFWKIKKIHFKENKSIELLNSNSRKILLSVYFVCMICKLLMYAKGGIPLFANNIDAARQNSAESFGMLKVISSAHTVIAVFMWYDLLVRIKEKQKRSISNYLVLLCSFIVAICDVSRLLIIQMVIPMILIYVIKIKRISLGKIISAVFLVLLFIGGNKLVRNILDNPEYYSYISANRDTNLFENIMLSCFTSFRVGIDDLRQLIEVVPSIHGYTNFQMFFNSILTVLPGKQIVIGYYVAELLGMKFDGIGAATTILGMFYLDGGPALIFFGMFLLGLFIEYFYIRYIRKGQIDITNVLAVYILYYSINCLRTNVMPTIEPLLFISFYFVFGLLIRSVQGENKR